MDYQWNIGIQNCKNEKNLFRSFVTMTYFLFTNVTLLYLKIAYLNNFKQLFFSKTTEAMIVKFHLKYDQTPGFQNYEFGLGQESKMAAVTKNSKTIKSTFSPEPLDIIGYKSDRNINGTLVFKIMKIKKKKHSRVRSQ